MSSSVKQLSSAKLHKRCCIKCCGGCTVMVAVVILVLALTVFKVKEPVISMNSIKLQKLSVAPGSSFSAPLAINMTIVADISAKNPNAASVTFGSSTTSLYYRGELVGVAYGPPGTAPAQRTFRMVATVDVMADQLLKDPNLIGDLRSGALEMSSSTNIVGRVKVLGVIKHHINGVMYCTMTVSTSNMSILDQNCGQHVRL